MIRVLHNPWVRLLLGAAVLVVVGTAVLRLSGVLTPFAVAFATAWLLNPTSSRGAARWTA